MPQNIHIYASAGKLCFYWNLLSSVYLVIIQHFFRFVNTFLQSFLCFLMFFTKKIRPAKAVQLGNLRKLVENATYSHSEYNVEHKKFIDFHYYDVSARYNGETYNLWLNVGVAKNDGTNHIYDITKDGRAANQSSTDLSRPVGYAMKNSSTIDSISQTESKSNTFEEKSSGTREKETRSAETIAVDAFARENIPDYAKLSEPNRQAIIMTINTSTLRFVNENKNRVNDWGSCTFKAES